MSSANTRNFSTPLARDVGKAVHLLVEHIDRTPQALRTVTKNDRVTAA